MSGKFGELLIIITDLTFIGKIVHEVYIYHQKYEKHGPGHIESPNKQLYYNLKLLWKPFVE